MDINNLQRTPSYSYQVDVDRIKKNLLQADKNSVSDQRQSDRVDISEEGRTALREKMSAIGKIEQNEDITKLSSMNFGNPGMVNDFERIMSELGEGTKTDTFDSYVNKMASAYQLMKDRIEEKYAATDRQKEYCIAADGNTQELTKEKELEMLDYAYETHSRLMAKSTQIWSELQDFKVQKNDHSGNSETEKSTIKSQNAGIEEQAYTAFMSAINKVGISSSARVVLNSIWDYYANMKQ